VDIIVNTIQVARDSPGSWATLHFHVDIIVKAIQVAGLPSTST
jgi:hypothetical protein